MKKQRQLTIQTQPFFLEADTTDIRRHHLFLLTLNDKLFLAPLKNPKRVLDIGTGIGMWVL